MDVKITHNDILARSKAITFRKNTVQSPNIIFILKKDSSKFPEVDLFSSSSQDCNDNISFQIANIKEKNEISYHKFCVENPRFYPKDIPYEVQMEKVANYHIEKKECCILPGNYEVLHELLPNPNPSLFIIQNAYQLYQNPQEFIQYITALHSLILPNQLLYFPGTADPKNLSLLIYFGIDLVDTTQALIAARNNQYFLHDDSFPVKNMDMLPCHCSVCEKNKHDPTNLSYNELFRHNYNIMCDELIIIQYAINHQHLRNHISKRVTSSPHLISLLRLFEKQGYHFLEENTPIYKESIIYATSLDALQRPEIKRFQERVINRFQKPSSASILLLLPCSAKKPYSFSKSHQKFKQILQTIPQQYAIHELIITSPLGIVPRELELCYPAASYDIPVTGDWFEDEIQLIKQQLQLYLQKNHYDTILIHLPLSLSESIKEVIPSAIASDIKGSASTNDALQKLKMLLSTTSNAPSVSGKKRFFENMVALATYQFSEPIANALLDHTIIKGKYPYLKIFDDEHIQIGMVTEKRGLISLTLEGGERITPFQKYYVTIDKDFQLKGSVFAPGVIDADPAIRSGDEVLVMQNDALKAVGVALMNGKDMKRLSYGKAVNIRHISS